MNRSDFLTALDACLWQLPEENRRSALDFYAEMIDDRMEDGLDEAAAVSSMGEVHEIARQVLEETPLTTLVRSRLPRRRMPLWLTVVLLVLGAPVWLPLAAAFAAVALTLYACVWILIGCCWICDVAFAMGLPLAIVTMFLSPGSPALVYVFLGGCGLALTGLGLLLFWPCVLLTRLFLRLSATAGRGLKRIFIRKERD